MFKRHGVYERTIAAVRRGADVGIGLPTLAELYADIEYSQSKERALEVLQRHLRLFKVWPLDSEAARRYGGLYASLRRTGVRMQTMDLQLASIALAFGQCVLVTVDSDFQRVPGLATENWRDAERPSTTAL
jgi:tRNA(fMet)-specific endonuclease VapC